MRQLERLSTTEIAAALGIAEGTVKSRHFRALERIRVLLGDES
jgi:DNA-directed RNA polymerase specialized sigma24 family protein